MKKISYIIMFVMLITLCVGSIVYADTVSFTVNGTTTSFDTGTGVDGDVEFKTDGMYVNGVNKCAPSGTETIGSTVFESYHSAKTYQVYVLETVDQYLPSAKTYPTTVPNFNNLTVYSGVILKSNSNGITMRVKGTLTDNGLIMTKHGAGGVGAVNSNGGNGGNASGDITIYANNVSIAATGTSAADGAILGGFGGGGAGGANGTFSGGNGGSAGAVNIFSVSVINNGEIRSGNGGGGGGGGAYRASFSDNYQGVGGTGGNAGNCSVSVKSLTNNGVIAAGYGGGGGLGGQGFGGFGGIAGYGGGGAGSVCNSSGVSKGAAAGGSGGSGGNSGQPGYWNGTVSGAGFGIGAGVNSGPGVTGAGSGGGLRSILIGSTWVDEKAGGSNGTMVITADTLEDSGNIEAGYTSGGNGGVRGKENITIRCNTVSGVLNSGDIISQVPNTRELSAYNSGITLNGAVTLETFNANGNVTINSGEFILTNALISGDFTVGSSAGITGNIGTQANPVASTAISGNIGNTTLWAAGDVRFKTNTNFQSDSWWTGRTVTVNGLRIRGALPSAAPNAMGLNEVNLSDWTPKYNPSGTLPIMRFIIEKQEDGAATWTASSYNDKNLNANVVWQDNSTVAGKKMIYRIGFKNPSSSLGYIYLETNTTDSSSEGGLGTDSKYKDKTAAYWAYQNSTPLFKCVSGISFTECVYDKLVDSETTVNVLDENGTVVGTIIAKPIKVSDTFTYTKFRITLTQGNPENPFRSAILGNRLILFKVISAPTISEVAQVSFGS